MQSSTPEFESTKTTLLEAAKSVLLSQGYSGLSTRAIAAKANTQMSQIRYHFGSKEGLVLALYEYMTKQVMDRQTAMFSDKTIPLSQKWDIACDYLDTDIATGYVRVFQELLALGWSNETIAIESKSRCHTGLYCTRCWPKNSGTILVRSALFPWRISLP